MIGGLEACRAIRRNPWGSQIRSYALSGWGQDVDKEESSMAGFDDHLVKPVERAHLERLVLQRPELSRNSGAQTTGSR